MRLFRPNDRIYEIFAPHNRYGKCKRNFLSLAVLRKRYHRNKAASFADELSTGSLNGKFSSSGGSKRRIIPVWQTPHEGPLGWNVAIRGPEMHEGSWSHGENDRKLDHESRGQGFAHASFRHLKLRVWQGSLYSESTNHGIDNHETIFETPAQWFTKILQRRFLQENCYEFEWYFSTHVSEREGLEYLEKLWSSRHVFPDKFLHKFG